MLTNNSLLNNMTLGKVKREESQHPSDTRKEKDNFLFQENNGFFMVVKINIMQDAGINKGDTILVNKSIKPLNGNVVVASVSGDVVIRFYQKVQAKIFLSGDVGKVCPMQIEAGFEDFEILGVVTHVIKTCLVFKL